MLRLLEHQWMLAAGAAVLGISLAAPCLAQLDRLPRLPSPPRLPAVQQPRESQESQDQRQSQPQPAEQQQPFVIVLVGQDAEGNTSPELFRVSTEGILPVEHGQKVNVHDLSITLGADGEITTTGPGAENLLKLTRDTDAANEAMKAVDAYLNDLIDEGAMKQQLEQAGIDADDLLVETKDRLRGEVERTAAHRLAPINEVTRSVRANVRRDLGRAADSMNHTLTPAVIVVSDLDETRGQVLVMDARGRVAMTEAMSLELGEPAGEGDAPKIVIENGRLIQIDGIKGESFEPILGWQAD